LIEGKAAQSPEEMPVTYCSGTTGDYFKAMGIPVIEGRAFDERDGKHSPAVVLIDSTMAHRFWPDEEAVGKRLQWQGKWREIIGVVGHVRSAAQESQIIPNMYVPYAQFEFPWPSMSLVARAQSNGADIGTLVRSAVAEQDKELPLAGAQTAEQLIASSLSRQRFNLVLLGIFAALSILLAAIGVYGIMAYSVSQRMHEIGVRISLGATRWDVLAIVLRQAFAVSIIGLSAGLLAAYALTRVMTKLLYGISPRDPAVFAVSSLIVFGVALLAAYVPARKGAALDPVIVLRAQ
jgi:putative ABC transport system permease protein